ncbi:mannose-6-phosphate isomerase [Streptomyces sp. CB00455]|uniref:mannose-6-phosphate isomerase, class I n=1 Tax=Streptomyces sp. CB00455 TaxID=1703927 RepID=UPI0009402E9B|nr:mannose-6-phosphate isomerase, class I [Streptomyces sp. CB00455]OKK16021.1 mannose-6-phosphate isomerase [Streptomyces sp. CB00455]
MDLLLNTVQPYAWGSVTALPRLLGTPPTGRPQAELWMGAHPAAPSHVDRGGGPVPLDAVIAADPTAELGPSAVRHFGPRLPFLLKLLAADAPLSVQVHPDRFQAAAGYARENALGIPLDARHRSYRDSHHKPEMIVALTGFHGLCGFRPPDRCAELLEALAVPGLDPLAGVLRTRADGGGLRDVFTALLSPPPGLLGAVGAAVRRQARREGPHRADFAAYEAIATAHPGDRGLLPALMLRHVRLAPGEALFLGAGIPHAYLSGLGVEVMACSDNVLRCGLTDKHVDLPELLKVVRFTSSATPVLTPRPGEDRGELLYPAPVADFRLSKLHSRAGEVPRTLGAGAPQIILCTEGEIRLHGDGASLRIGPGRSVYVPARERVAVTGDGTAFRATIASGDGPAARRGSRGSRTAH